MNLFESLVPPLLTADLPGIGGQIKAQPEDFEVEEIPAYEPAGSGDHLFLWVEKRDMGAEYFTRQVARRLEIAAGDVGLAGLKDRHAVTRQYVSVPATAEAKLGQLDGDGIRLLRQARHNNKLRPGHLRGNLFRILIREVDPSSAPKLDAILNRIQQFGLPNFYGEQRFGKDGETAKMGMALVKGEGKSIRAPFLRKLALSAAQSLLFNAYLAQRMADGLMRTVLQGDVMAKWPAGGMFTAEDIEVEQRRFEARETVHAGPMFGRKTFPSKALAAEREARILEASGLTARSFDGFGKLLMGTRRHNLVYVGDIHTQWEADGVRLTFSLPAGSYATVLLRELTRSALPEIGESA
jgi:tRNA pseudouridine13 synthase